MYGLSLFDDSIYNRVIHFRTRTDSKEPELYPKRNVGPYRFKKDFENALPHTYQFAPYPPFFTPVT